MDATEDEEPYNEETQGNQREKEITTYSTFRKP